ncbi:MAG: lipid-A-disaccharide synthase [Candidatus Binatus sp.]|uniref:lipid-A-disaccharide synthase n=1 Tax=Candidatus Binatus sp. TaxID=2811406 RepID=UPI0027275F64|nr:lipid-A-disaccharide synthase [Candidatus Binatus sp.]MDO8432005.1 lipid-A-disaccharide synthase [Candidatus Binatus sp.]
MSIETDVKSGEVAAKSITASDAGAEELSKHTIARARRRRIMIVAGEASGDLHGGDLAREILARDPGCELFGIAGEKMRAAGVRAIVEMESIHGLGLSELAATIGRTVAAFRELRRVLRREKPDLLILIDYAEFNLILSGTAKRAGVPVLYYITPQVWAWRRGRVDKLVERADRLAVVLPFEAELYHRAGERVSFVGHPLLDRVSPPANRAEVLKRHGFSPGTRILALLPGSRRAEVKYLLRPMIEAARVLARDHGLEPVIALAPTLTPSELEEVGRTKLDGIRIVEGDTYSIVGVSEMAIVASGTATLETALLGCPEVIVYKVSALTYVLGRMLITGVDFIGMPNILAGRKIVPELIQREVTATNIVRAAESILSDTIRAETIKSLKSLREKLGLPGAASRVAWMALGMIE